MHGFDDTRISWLQCIDYSCIGRTACILESVAPDRPRTAPRIDHGVHTRTADGDDEAQRPPTTPVLGVHTAGRAGLVSARAVSALVI